MENDVSVARPLPTKSADLALKQFKPLIDLLTRGEWKPLLSNEAPVVQRRRIRWRSHRLCSRCSSDFRLTRSLRRCAGYGGLKPGLLTTAIGVVLATYFFVAPRGSIIPTDFGDFLGLILFVTISSFISIVCGRLIEARKHESALRTLFQQTLVSIGDGLISVDTGQCVRLMNPVAEQLTGWTQSEAHGRHISEVFQIVKENTDEPAVIPVEGIMKQGIVVGLANHTELITKSGERIPIDDSGAPVRSPSGEVAGAVLVFRDVRDRRKASGN
jgi:PAS domain S-box-containing protein